MKIRTENKRIRTDPICGMQLRPNRVVLEYSYYGVTYAFCSAACRNHFRDGAELYVAHMTVDPQWALGHPCPHQQISQMLDM
ncbi:MAG: YHS domain-containing protein [Caldilineales bacterium]|nr:YHS domain-containing protein [Caldilineales bacterium]